MFGLNLPLLPYIMYAKSESKTVKALARLGIWVLANSVNSDEVCWGDEAGGMQAIVEITGK